MGFIHVKKECSNERECLGNRNKYMHRIRGNPQHDSNAKTTDDVVQYKPFSSAALYEEGHGLLN